MMNAPATLTARQIRTLITLSCGAFASQASVRLCDPMLPQLSAELGESLGEVAQTITSFSIAYGLFQLIHGPMGDRFGKLRWVRYATVSAAIASLACMFAGSLLQLITLRFLTGAACAALIPLSLAWIGDSVPYQNRQNVLAKLMTGSTIGVVFGQVAGGVLADTIGWRLSFGFPAVVLAAVAAMLFLDARRDARDAPQDLVTEPGPVPSPSVIARQFGSVLAVPWARVLLTVVFIEGMLVYGAFAYVPSWLHLHYDMPLWQCGLAAAGFGVGGMIYALSSSVLIKQLGERGLLIGGSSSFAVGMLLIGGSWWPAQSLYCALAGLGFFMMHNTLQVHATQMAPNARGTGIAAFAVGLFSGQSTGVAVGSVLVGAIGFESVLLGSSVLLMALAGTMSMLLTARNRSPS
jgi:predicted MFS family arabinose efflux permease